MVQSAANPDPTPSPNPVEEEEDECDTYIMAGEYNLDYGGPGWEPKGNGMIRYDVCGVCVYLFVQMCVQREMNDFLFDFAMCLSYVCHL